MAAQRKQNLPEVTQHVKTERKSTGLFLVNELRISGDAPLPWHLCQEVAKMNSPYPFSFLAPLCLMVVLPHSRNRHMARRVFHIFIRASTAGRREQSTCQHPGYHLSSQLQGPSSSRAGL